MHIARPISLRGVSLLAAASTLLAVSAAQAQSIVDLRLVGPATPIIPGQVFEVKLRAERQDPALAASFVAIDCIVGWNPAEVQFLSMTTTGSTALTQSYLPTVANDYTGINEVIPPADGNLLYYALAPLGAPKQVPVAGLQVVTFRFQSLASSTFTSTPITVIDNLNIAYPTETIVYDGVVPGVDDFGIGYAANITQLDCSTIFWYRDSDGDGAGDPADSTTSCTQPTGFVSSSTDLCPTNAALLAPVTYYADADSDGFGSSAAPSAFCETSAPAGYVANADDCNDASVIYGDGDGDGFGAGAMVACNGVATSDDCNDASNLVYPGALENCANLGTDNDCDGVNNAAEATDSVGYYVDGDSDGFGAGSATPSCTAIGGSVTNNLDCNDALVTYADGDGDGFGAGAMTACGIASNNDCDDANSAAYPGAAENCANDGVDNDCDGEANADAEAVDSIDYFPDTDGDGFGTGTAIKGCTQPAGHVLNDLDCYAALVTYDDNDGDGFGFGPMTPCGMTANNTDCDDAAVTYGDDDGDGYGAGPRVACNGVTDNTDCNNANNLVYPGAPETCGDLAVDNNCNGSTAESEANDRLTFYADTDGDGAGDAAATTLACSLPNGYVATAGDGCPADGAKIAPGICGCGTPDSDLDSDGNPDCFGQIAALTLASDDIHYGVGEQVLVRVNMGESGTALRSADLSITFDAANLELVSASPVAGSAFSLEGSETIDNTLGSLRYSISVPVADLPTTGPAALVDLVFNIRAGASFCGTGGLVTFGSIGGLESRLTTGGSATMIPSVAALGSISLLSSGPVLAGIPAASSIAADAGATDGAYVAAPTVTASDLCGTSLAVSVLITYPDATTATAWPANGVFPIGVSSIAYSTTDAIGQTDSEITSITVADHQLMDVDVSLFGSITQTSTRSIRVKVGGTTQLFSVELVAGQGTISGIQVPVALEYPCVLVKDPVHSVSASGAATVAGVRYAVSAQLVQGDSNDDDVIDVLDFGTFVGDRGAEPTRSGRSNYNADLAVNNGDFGFIALKFLTVGDSCGAFDGPGQPLERISVKELRRRGLGHMAKSDFNRDGWLDVRDIEIYMRGGN